MKSEAVRARIEAAAREATGRELRYAEVDAGLLPPRLVVEHASLAGPTPEAPPFFEGASLELRLALAPLLARALVADSVTLRPSGSRVTSLVPPRRRSSPPRNRGGSSS